MGLRLRRGTTTERSTVTFAEGELVYTTDTQEIWVGDGVTQGGVKVSGLIPESLNDLDDVDLSTNTPQIGQILAWNGEFFEPVNYTNNEPPVSPQGKEDDRIGDFAFDEEYFYYCIGDYDGSSVIWRRIKSDTEWV